MSEPWTFRNLDLSDVDAQRSGGGMAPGPNVCVINKAELKPSKSGIQIVLYLGQIEGAGETKDYITLHSNSNEENMKTAERIGKQRFKAVLECAQHPSPNNPSDIHSVEGLVVGVICERGEDWVNQDGETRPGGVKPRKNGAYVPASTLGYSGPLKVSTVTPKVWTGTSPAKPKTPAIAGADLDDDIPF